MRNTLNATDCQTKVTYKQLLTVLLHVPTPICMGRQMYFYYLEWLLVYNQNKGGYLQITTLQFYYF